MANTVRAIFRGLLLLLGMAGFWTSIYLYLTQQMGDKSRVVVQGAGNSGNTINVDTVVDELAAQLAQQPAFDPIDAKELSKIGAAVRKKALEGDPTAALVMLRVAQLQRTNNEG